jgi:hypothetical protein
MSEIKKTASLYPRNRNSVALTCATFHPFMKSNQSPTRSHFSRTVWPLATLLAISSVSSMAQTNNFADLRDLRVACLETFNSARSRLDELHAFVEQQAAGEKSAASQLFQLRHNADDAKRRIEDLKQTQVENKTRLENARTAVQRATVSYAAAVKALPNDEKWASEGSAAINELRRAVTATPQIEWKRKRLKEVESEYVETIKQWRAARRSFEQANFDLELRTSPGVFKRVDDEAKSTDTELDSLSSVLAEREKTLDVLGKDSSRWGNAMQGLYEQQNAARKRLSSSISAFHLVDLKFAAWRLVQSEDKDYAMEALPDILEESLPGYSTQINGHRVSGLSNAMEGGAMPISSSAPADAAPLAAPSAPEPDPAFAAILKRVELLVARLDFVAGLWEGEVASVRSSVTQLEAVQEKVASTASQTASAAASIEELRRSLVKEQLALAAGLETLDLVKKRFSSDFADITRLLDDATIRTDKLEKGLERK